MIDATQMSKQEFIEQKKKKLEELTAAQEGIVKEIEAIGKLQYVDFKTTIERATRIVGLIGLAKSIEGQKATVISQPFPKYPKGGPSVVS